MRIDKRMGRAILALTLVAPALGQTPNANPKSTSFYKERAGMVSCSVSNTSENDASIQRYLQSTKNAPSIKLTYSGGESGQAPTEITVVPEVSEPGVTRLLNCQGLVNAADAIVEAGKPYKIRFDEGGSKRVIATHTTPDGRMNYDILKVNLQDPREMTQQANEIAGSILPSLCMAGRSELSGYLNLYRDNLYDLLGSAGSFEEMPFILPALPDLTASKEDISENLQSTISRAVQGGGNPILDYEIEAADPDGAIKASDALYSNIYLAGPQTIKLDTSKVSDPDGHAMKFFWVLWQDGKAMPEKSGISYPGHTEYVDLNNLGRYTLLTGAVCEANKLSIRRHEITAQ